jgi:hypothetical protein
MNTEENNQLIAEFMEMQKTDIGWYDAEELMDLWYTMDNTFDELLFNKSWDWLMPVVEKIESDERFDVNVLQYGTIISSNTKERGHIEIVNNVANISFDSKIDHTYQAVVEFIKQYNK